MRLFVCRGMTMESMRRQFRHRVISKFSRKRLTSQQTLQCEPRSAYYTESLNGLVRVSRAGGLKAAASSHQNRKVRFLKTQREQRQTYCSCVQVYRPRTDVGAFYVFTQALQPLFAALCTSRKKS